MRENTVTLLKQALYGILFGYMILHPVTMVIYHFDVVHEHNSVYDVFSEVYALTTESFQPVLNRMSIYFTIFGAFMGLASGLHINKIRSRDRLIKKQEKELSRNILELISAGETTKVEFKSTARWDEQEGKVNKRLEKAVIKTFAGFMNGTGGTLLLGVKDNGEINGLEKDYLSIKHRNRDGYQQYLMQLTSAHLGADLCCKINTLFHRMEGKDICQVYVKPSERPVFIENGREAQFYLRTGNTTHELNVKEAMRYITSKWEVKPDNSMC